MTYSGNLISNLAETVKRIQGEIVMCPDCPNDESAHVGRIQCEGCDTKLCVEHVQKHNDFPGDWCVECIGFLNEELAGIERYGDPADQRPH